jgi:hypothetical protein
MDIRAQEFQEFYAEGSVDVAQRIEVDGVQLIRGTNGRFYGESGSTPGTMYLLTGFSCQCPGFAYRQTCKHHRALMVALGWTEDAPKRLPVTKPAPKVEPAPLEVHCSACHGVGSHPGTVSTGRSLWRYDNVTCDECHGVGRIIVSAAA